MNSTYKESPVTDLPYSERQFLIINNKIEKSNSFSNIFDDLVREVDKPYILKYVIPLLGPALFRLPVIVAFGVGLGIRELQKMKKMENLLVINPEEAKVLEFPPGHPKKGVFYIAHPVDPKRYYTAAQFHRLAFEHKFGEAISLLMSLGAKKIQVEHKKGWNQEFSSNINLDIPLKNIDIKGETKFNKKRNNSLLFEATLEGETEPSLPNNLVWYHHEPTWQQISNGRLNHGLKEFSLAVSYEDDFGVNADLKKKIHSCKFELGGSFVAHQDTVWRIVGEF
ncbi:hypothetical protein V7114_23695 [Neobacillus niacini]|uniref:hypothetical protein n=1 Tax=Neobacillus niacini TaxID=86668 RepID=UPI003000373E